MAVEGDLLHEMEAGIKGVLPNVEALILEDYGKAVIQDQLLKKIVPDAMEKGKIVTVDPKEDHLSYYRGITAITPNRLEAEQASGIRICDEKSLFQAGERLMERLQCMAVLITLGAEGMCLFERDKAPLQIPAPAREVFDVSGAGDTVIAMFTTALVAGATFRQAALLSNIAGGLVVEKLGTATVNLEEVEIRLRELSF